MTSVDVLAIKIDTGSVSSIRTRNLTRENIIYKSYKEKITSKVLLLYVVPSTQTAFAICIARQILLLEKLPALGSSVQMLRFLENVLEKISVLGRASPESQKLVVEKDTHLLDLYTCQFFLLPHQPQPYQGYNQTCTGSKGVKTITGV